MSMHVAAKKGLLVLCMSHWHVCPEDSPPCSHVLPSVQQAAGPHEGPQLRLVIIQPNGKQLAKVASLLERRAIHPPRIARAFPLERARCAAG